MMDLYQLVEEMDPDVKKSDPNFKKLQKTISFLEKKKKVLLLTTSNRGEWAEKTLDEVPKSTKLAKSICEYLGKSKCTLIEVPKLKIYPCEGNVSHLDGNSCGVLKSKLKDKNKNPSGHHRCWRNINNPDDQLWKISKELFESDCVLFFGSVRWGQTNAQYQNLIERLTWLENRHSTLNEKNILESISCGLILVGQNWNGSSVLDTQKSVLKFFGFKIENPLFWNWQYTDNSKDESQSSYKKSGKEFNSTFSLKK
jgi:multimeric flavodoxin WrbA